MLGLRACKGEEWLASWGDRLPGGFVSLAQPRTVLHLLAVTSNPDNEAAPPTNSTCAPAVISRQDQSRDRDLRDLRRRAGWRTGRTECILRDNAGRASG